jgi:hypothetical protein
MIELEVRGRWNRRLSLDVYCALRDCLANTRWRSSSICTG